MTHPFSQEPVEAALFEALLSRRRSLAETGDPLKAKRLLKEIKSISHTADLLLFSGVSEHMHVACDEMLQCGAHSSRVVLAAAKLKPAFFNSGKFEDLGISKMDEGQALARSAMPSPHSQNEGQAGTSAMPNAKPFAEGGRAGTLLSGDELTQKMEGREAPLESKTKGYDGWMEGRQAGSMDDGQAGTFSKEAPVEQTDGWQAGTFVIRGSETGQIKIVMADGQGYAPEKKKPGQALIHGWSPTDDVATGQAPIHTTAPSLGKRRVGRHLWRIKP